MNQPEGMPGVIGNMRHFLFLALILAHGISFSQKVDKYRCSMMLVDRTPNVVGKHELHTKKCDVIITFEPKNQKIKIFSAEDNIDDDLDILKYDSHEGEDTSIEIKFNVSLIDKRGNKCKGVFRVMTVTGDMWLLTIRYPDAIYTYMSLQRT